MPKAKNDMQEITLLIPTRRQSLRIAVPEGTGVNMLKRCKDELAARLDDPDLAFKINGTKPVLGDLAEIQDVFNEEGIAIRVDGGFVDDDAPLVNGQVVAAAREQNGGR